MRAASGYSNKGLDKLMITGERYGDGPSGTRHIGDSGVYMGPELLAAAVALIASVEPAIDPSGALQSLSDETCSGSVATRLRRAQWLIEQFISS